MECLGLNLYSTLNSILDTCHTLSIWDWVKFITGCNRWPAKIYQRWRPPNATTKLFFGDRRAPPNYFFTSRHLNAREVWQLWQTRTNLLPQMTLAEMIYIYHAPIFPRKMVVGIDGNTEVSQTYWYTKSNRLTLDRWAERRWKQGNWEGGKEVETLPGLRTTLLDSAQLLWTFQKIPAARHWVKLGPIMFSLQTDVSKWGISQWIISSICLHIDC